MTVDSLRTTKWRADKIVTNITNMAKAILASHVRIASSDLP